MWLVEDHLWSHVVEGTTEGLARTSGGVFSAPTKITQLDVSIGVQKQVFRLVES
jgi:hypothetical protein